MALYWDPEILQIKLTFIPKQFYFYKMLKYKFKKNFFTLNVYTTGKWEED